MIRKFTLLFFLSIGLHLIAKAAPPLSYVTISITSGADTSCVGTSLTFTALSNDVTASYKWFVDDVYTGVTTTTYTSSTLANGDYIYCKIYFLTGGNPDSAQSNTITVYRYPYYTPSISIALTNGPNPGCPQSVLTFTADTVNAGTMPALQWTVNGLPQTGATNITYTGVFNNGDMIGCYLITNTPCSTIDTAFSNSISVIHFTLTADITISGGPIPECAGHPVIFTAQTNNQGANSSLQWNINNIPVPGATNYVFTDTFSNNDVVTCVLTAPDECINNHTAVSNPITVPVVQGIIGSVRDSIISGNNPGCLDSTIVFGAIATNFGSNPHFTWLVNGVVKDTGHIFSTDSLLNGDSVTVRVNQTDGQCYRFDSLLSIPIIVHLDTTPNPPIISLIGNHLIGNDTGTYIWYGPNGLITGDDSEVYHPLVLGQYYAQRLVDGCLSPISNILTISLLDVGSYNMSQVKVYPNPTKGQLVLDWGTRNVTMGIDVYSVLGQGLLHDQVSSASRKIIDLAGFADGNYFIVLKDADGSTATVKITVAK